MLQKGFKSDQSTNKPAQWSIDEASITKVYPRSKSKGVFSKVSHRELELRNARGQCFKVE